MYYDRPFMVTIETDYIGKNLWYYPDRAEFPRQYAEYGEYLSGDQVTDDKYDFYIPDDDPPHIRHEFAKGGFLHYGYNPNEESRRCFKSFFFNSLDEAIGYSLKFLRSHKLTRQEEKDPRNKDGAVVFKRYYDEDLAVKNYGPYREVYISENLGYGPTRRKRKVLYTLRRYFKAQFTIIEPNKENEEILKNIYDLYEPKKHVPYISYDRPYIVKELSKIYGTFKREECRAFIEEYYSKRPCDKVYYEEYQGQPYKEKVFRLMFLLERYLERIPVKDNQDLDKDKLEPVEFIKDAGLLYTELKKFNTEQLKLTERKDYTYKNFFFDLLGGETMQAIEQQAYQHEQEEPESKYYKDKYLPDTYILKRCCYTFNDISFN